jgi:saccharopine dehydrogenase-like NADP-dependent oxidoreductase
VKRVLVLGAGLVARPLVRYFLARPGIRVTVADRERDRADALVAGAANGVAPAFDVDDAARLAALVADCDLAVSLLPYVHHAAVAEACIARGRHLVTTSYVSDAMRALDARARAAGVVLLNEVGLDPGIDHMSAMRIFDGVAARGGRVVSFRSYCGGLPAPEADTNPLGYKFSWSPRGVLLAGRNPARYLEDGEVVEVPGPELFDHHRAVEVPGAGTFEGYPNRDSLGYRDVYGLGDARTVFRGTLRLPGWCRAMKKMADLGMFALEPLAGPAPATWAEWTARLAGLPSTAGLRAAVAERIAVPVDSNILDRWEFLGLFSDEPLPGGSIAPLDTLVARMQEKMAYGPGERDQVVLFHEVVAEYPDHRERITSTLVAFGEPGGDSAMSRTVGLPAAIGARMVLEGRVRLTGVHVPVTPAIYGPVLDELATLGIECREAVNRL